MTVSAPDTDFPPSFGGLYYCEYRNQLLSVTGKSVDVRNKTLEVFKLLADNHGCVLSRAEIIDQVWCDTVVSDDSLTQCICDIRRLLGDRAFHNLKTHHRRGYSLIPDKLTCKQPPANAAIPLSIINV